MRARKIIKQSDIDYVIRKCKVCYMSMVDLENKPYVLPFNFGYKDDYIYLHSDREGKKIDILKKNPDVCISFSTDYELYFQNEKVACSYGMKYKSVLVYGKVEFIDEYDKKVEVMNVIMSNYSDKNFKFSEPSVKNVKTFRVKLEEVTAKEFGHF
ncbi:MAG: pyridoxamine 5'-phosphate oxidase family protein [Bacteroidales bacterium]|nr:pyridoxamine 5'-phosphate oxidase family protein [Bacteroidales bacterium]